MNFTNLNDSNTLSNFLKYISKMNTTSLIIIVSIILFLVSVVFYYYFYVGPNMKTSYSAKPREGFENKSAELLFFYADWCPHCKTAKPIWQEMETEYENQTINGYKVKFTEINCTTESEDVEKLMNKYNIEGFPTIKLIKDGQIIEYDAKPTKESLTEFLNTVL